MFQSSHNTSKIQELRTFLAKVSTFIIESQNVDTPTFKIRQNFVPAYTLVYDMCTQKPSLEEKMLQEFKHCLTHFIQTYTMHAHQQTNYFRFSLENSSKVFDWFNCLWIKFVKFLIAISKKVFAYLDRRYLPGAEEQSLYRVGLRTFKKNVCHEQNMKFFEDCFLKQIREIRERKVIYNSELLKFTDAIAVIDSQQLIINLTNRFIEESKAYYQSLYQKSSPLPSIKYYNIVNNTLLFEQAMISMSICMTPFELTRVFQAFSENLVEKFTETFCKTASKQHGLRKMFEVGNTDFMRVVNDIYRRFQGFDKIKESYYEYLLEEGNQILSKFKGKSDIEKTLPIIEEIHHFYKSQLTTLSRGFNKRNELLVTLNNAIQKIISKQERFTQILFTFTSRSRQQGTFQANKEKIDLLFDKTLSKDEFVGLYQIELFKKITSGTVNLQKEQNFVNYLNGICGSEITHKLVKKIKDIAEVPDSKTLTKDLHTNTQLNVHVLSLPLWQKAFVDQISLNLSLPPILESTWKSIQKNFIELEPKKKLIPLPFENKLTIDVKFNKRNFLMKCNLIQASIFCFLASKSYTSEQDIINQLSIEKNLVQSTMETFESIPHLLLKTTLGDFIVNWYFDQNENIIDLVSHTQESNKQMSKAIKQDREILVEAAIVKFVKRAKRGTFEEVVQGVVKAIRLFKPLPHMIKTSVDKLLKKGFLEEAQGGFLEYVQ